MSELTLTAEAAAPEVAGATTAPSSAATAPIVVTEKAIAKIRQTFEKQGVQGFLRLGILGGGCSGLSYQFKFDTRSRVNDKVFEFGDVKIVVDPKSFLYLSGLTLDYKETLMQSGFEFINPHATKSCGCGTSFAG